MRCCHADQDFHANFVSDKNSLEDENSGCSMLSGKFVEVGGQVPPCVCVCVFLFVDYLTIMQG